VIARPAWRRLALVGDGIINPVAVEIAARGARPAAPTRAGCHLAAAAILARGGTDTDARQPRNLGAGP
jgi:hypothetical protein